MDEFFAFLHRRTDFYVEFEPLKEGEKKAYSMGFPKGYAQAMVVNSFRKFPMKSYEEQQAKLSRPPYPPAVPTKKSSSTSSSNKKVEQHPVTPTKK